jgi:ribosomal protein L21
MHLVRFVINIFLSMCRHSRRSKKFESLKQVFHFLIPLVNYMMVSFATTQFLNCFILFPNIIILNCFSCVGHLAEGNCKCTSLGAQEEPLRQVDVEDDIKLDDVVLVGENENRQSADASVENIELLASRDEGAEGTSVVRLQQERTLSKKKRGQRRVQGSRT